MARALLVLYSDAMRRKAHEWIDRAPKETRIEFKGPARSLDQNAKMWALLTEVAEQIPWYGQKLAADDWKDVFTASLRRARVVPGLDPGTYVPLGMRTSDMSKDELSNLIELIHAFGADHGVVFHDSDSEAAA